MMFNLKWHCSLIYKLTTYLKEREAFLEDSLEQEPNLSAV